MSAQRNFTLTTPMQNVRAHAEGGARIVYTVANTSGLANRAMARVVSLGDTRSEWLALEGQTSAISRSAASISSPSRKGRSSNWKSSSRRGPGRRPGRGRHHVQSASANIEKVGLVAASQNAVDYTRTLGTVIAQSPVGGTEVKRGTRVTVTVASNHW